MDSRSTTPEENFDDLFDGLTEEQLEEELAKLEEETNRKKARLKELDDKDNDLLAKINESNRKLQECDDIIATSEKRIEELDAKYDEIIDKALPLTGAVTQFDFSKVQSDDPKFVAIMQKGLTQKTPATTPARYSPPSSTKTSTPPSTGSDLSRVSSPSLSANNSGSDSDEKERSKLSPQTKAPAIPAKQPVVSIQLPRSTAAITSTLSKDAAVKKPTPAPALPKVVAPVVKTVESKPANAAKAPDPKKPGLLAKFGFKKEEAQPAKTPAVVATATKPGMSKAH